MSRDICLRCPETSQGSGWDEPDTLKAEDRVLGDQVVVAVVVQNTRAGLVRAGGDQDIGWGEAMVADGCELSQRLQRAAFHRVGDKSQALHVVGCLDVAPPTSDCLASPT